MSSCPTLMIRSELSMALCRKSLAEREALPRKSGSLSSRTPLPIWVLMKGIPVLSTNARSIRAGSLRLAPAPIRSSGFFASSIMSTACFTALFSATGLRARLAGMGLKLVFSEAMSSGSSRWEAPGRSSCEIRKASRTLEGMLFPLTI